jgi:hypothetical protein
MKKISLILAIVLMAVSLTSCKKDNESTSSVIELPPIEMYETDEFVTIGTEKGFDYIEYSDHVEITDCDNATIIENIDFPAVIAGKPVTVISITTIKNNAYLNSVSLPDTVQEICNNIFAYCTNLSEVKISKNLKKIGCSAFFGTAWFKALDDEFVIVGDGVLIKYNGDSRDVVVPEEVKYLSDAFSETSKIISIELPSSVTGFSDYAFYNCSSLSEINIPSHISDIGIHAFDKTTWIMLQDDEFATVGNSVLVSYNGDGGEVVIPDGIKYIAGAFHENEAITSVIVPESVIRVRSASFMGCKNLEKVEFKGRDTFLESAVFAECTHLSDVTLPAGLKVLELQTFYGCSKLTDIKLPDSIEFIGMGAFYSCSTLNNVEMGNNVTTIATAAFFGCVTMKKITLPDSVEKFGDVPFGCCYELSEFTVPPKVTEITTGFFSYCVKIPELRFGEQIASIGDGAFEGCADLKVYIEGADTTLGKDIFLDSVDGSRKVYCKKGSVAEKYLKENKIKYSILKD